GKRLVNQGAVCESKEFTVAVFFAQADNIVLPYQRFSAGINIHVSAECLSLLNNAVQRVVIHIEPVAVICGPAAGAVQIARGGRVHQNCPWNVAVVFFLVFVFPLAADDRRMDDEIFEGFFPHARINIRVKAHN
ncbi:hypothetical protein C1H57_25200, partial [Clostridium sp. 2-1]